MSKIINIGPLAFYDSPTKQQHQKFSAFGQIWPLIVELGKFPVFQFMANPSFAPASGKAVSALTMSRVNAQGEIMWTESWPWLDWVQMIGSETHTTFISTPEDIDLSFLPALQQGYYFLTITDDVGNTYTSDIFAYRKDVSNLLKLEYSNTYNFQIAGKEILFDGMIQPFRPYIYIDTQLGRPEYKFEEEVVSRLGYEYIESQVSKKQYKFEFVAPEYLLDAMRFIRLCENKKCVYSGEEYDMLAFNIEVSWGAQGDLASVSASFDVDNIVANTGGIIP